MNPSLPEQGCTWPELEAELQEAKRHDVDWRNGRVPMFIHHAGDEVLEVSRRAYDLYFSENGLGLRAFRSLARFESEVVAMGLSLLHGGEQQRGAMTTGGTESIFLAVKAARDHAQARQRDGAVPRIVLARSAHPAFDKAAHFMGLEVVRTPLAADFRADPQAIEDAVNDATVMVVGSVPAFPHGVVDPLPELSSLAERRGLWLHVDACVGGYLAPFARQLGEPIPDWDFALPGVSSISADLHKYGYSAKGASTLFFRDAERFAHMGWAFDAWPRGGYFTHTLVGTRAGGAIASAWAVMRHLGHEGYRRITRRVLDTRQALQDGAARLGLATYGDPRLAILAYGAPGHDFGAVAAAMGRRGWVAGQVRDPDGLHHMLNLTHEPVVDRYLADLAAALDEARLTTSGSVGGQPVRY